MATQHARFFFGSGLPPRAIPRTGVHLAEATWGTNAVLGSRITKTYCAALRAHGLQAFFATDASVQPGQLQDLMLHETAVSWLRRRLARTLPRSPWEETSEEYGARLKACAAYINEHHDVDNLCRGLPARLHGLNALEGDRLGH